MPTRDEIILALTDEERKARRKEVRDRPENKAKRKISSKEYDSRPEVKAQRKEYRQRPEVKAHRQEYSKDFRDRPENKAKRTSPEVKVKAKNTRINTRLNVLQHYSKLHSNSDIPCCRCCGSNSHIDFLSLDHISGKQEMNAEPELVKLNYSSKWNTHVLSRWIMANNYLLDLKKDYFQILCHNCNFTKGMKKNNNKCSHEMK